jgi:uncharacterized protein YukE
MTATAQPSALAPFSHDWIGADIRGLSEFAGVLYGYAPKIDNVAGALDDQVSGMVSAADWQGAAASAFKSSWGKDSVAAQEVASMAVGIGQIVDELAVSLSRIESALETEADYASSHGVQIGPDGQPPAPTSAFSVNETAYRETYEGAQQQAQTARQNAVNALARYNGPNHSLANKVFGTAGAAAAEYALVRYGGLEAFQAGASLGGEAAGALSDAVLGTESGIAIAAGSAIGFVAVPVVVGFVGYGVGVFVASLIEGKSAGQSLDIAADTLAEPFKDAAVGIGHEAEHLWDDVF